MNIEERLSAWLHQATPEPPRRIAVADIIEHDTARRHQATVLRQVSASAAAVVLIVALGLGVARISGLFTVTSPGTPSQTAAPYPSRSPSSSVSPSSSGSGLPIHSWGARLVAALNVSAGSTLSDHGRLYALLASPSTNSGGLLVRLDPSTGRVLERGVAASSQPVASGGLIWVISSGAGGKPTLVGVDPVNLTIRVSLRTGLSENGLVLAAGGDTVVLGAGRQVRFVRGRQVVDRLTVDGPISSLALSPDQTRLYVGVGIGAGGRIETLSPRSGTALAAPVETGVPFDLQASDGGVWSGSAGGHGAGIGFLPTTGSPPDMPTSVGASGGGLDVGPSISGGVAWLGGYDRIGCADPRTGTLRAQTAVGSDSHGDVLGYISGITVIDKVAYTVYTGSGPGGQQLTALIAMTPPASCFR